MGNKYPKNIVITGLPNKNWSIDVTLSNTKDYSQSATIAWGIFVVVNGKLEVSLIKPEVFEAWTGSGEYFVIIQPQVSNTSYITKQKVFISKAVTALAFSDFEVLN